MFFTQIYICIYIYIYIYIYIHDDNKNIYMFIKFFKKCLRPFNKKTALYAGLYSKQKNL